MGQYRLPWLRHPFFLSESQYDSFQLYWALGGRSPPYAGDAQVASYATRGHGEAGPARNGHGRPFVLKKNTTASRSARVMNS